MERMLRKKKDNSDYEIDRELTGKFAIEKNAEYQEKIEQLEEENKKLKECNKSQSEVINNVFIPQRERLEEENRKWKERINELEKCNLNLQEWLDRKEELNKSYRKEIKEHQLYEKKLEHRIIELEELLHGE